MVASGDPKDGVAGPQREAAAAVADRGGRGAPRQVGHSQGQGDQARAARRGDGAENGTGLACFHLAIPFSITLAARASRHRAVQEAYDTGYTL